MKIYVQKDYKGDNFITARNRIIWRIFELVKIVLLFRFILKLFNANPGNLFAGVIYRLSTPLIYPFTGTLNSTVILNGYAIELGTLIGILVYTVFAYILVYLNELAVKRSL